MITTPIRIHKNSSQISNEQLDVLLENTTANFFQTKEAIHFFRSVGLETFVFAIEHGKKLLAFVSGIIQKEKGLKSTFTKRAIIYGGPVLSPDLSEKQIVEFFSTIIKELKNKAIYIEIRNFNDYSAYKTILDKTGFEYHPHLNFHVQCDSEDIAKKRLSNSKLRQIKKSIKEGAIVKEAIEESEIEAFYEILKNLYKTKVKTPLPDLYFFTTLWSQGVTKFFLVFYRNKVIGGIVCPIFKNKVIYEWFVCGMDRTYKNVYPSILATWYAITYACKNNIERFDFMGAGRPDDDYGVREFKSKFGGELVEHGRFIHVAQPFFYQLGKTAVRILKDSK